MPRRETRRPGLAAISFGAALLVRETGVILLVALVLASGRPLRAPEDDGLAAARGWTHSTLVLAARCYRFLRGVFSLRHGYLAILHGASIVAEPWGDLGMPFAGLLHFMGTESSHRRRRLARSCFRLF